MLLELAKQVMDRLPLEIMQSLGCSSQEETVKDTIAQVLAESASGSLSEADVEWKKMILAILYHRCLTRSSFPNDLIRPLGKAILADQLFPGCHNSSETVKLAHAAFEKFAANIRPRTLWKIASNRTKYVERLKQFAAYKDLTDEEIKSRVLRLASGRLDNEHQRFFRKIPTWRIQTYTDEIVSGVIQNFLAWEPVMQFLETGEPAFLMSEFHELQKRTINVLSQRGIARQDAEDGVQEAFQICIEGISDPLRGYIYESPFPAWLINTALNVVWNHAEPMDELDLIHTPTADLHGPLDDSLFFQWCERYQFVLSTYREDKVRERVKAMVRSQLNEESLTDRELAERIQLKTGAECNSRLIALTRMVFRGRMEVFRYLESRSHEEMVEWIRGKWGVRPADIPPLHKIAASARAAEPEGTLGWALIACAAFEDEKFGSLWGPKAREWLRRKDWGQHNQRYDSWVSKSNPGAISPFLNRANLNGMSWAVPACWHLIVLRDVAADEVVKILHCKECSAIAMELKGLLWPTIVSTRQ